MALFIPQCHQEDGLGLELHRIEFAVDVFSSRSQPNDDGLTLVKDLVDDAVGGAVQGEMQGAQQPILALQRLAGMGVGDQYLGFFNQKTLDVGRELLKQGQGGFVDVEGIAHAITQELAFDQRPPVLLFEWLHHLVLTAPGARG
jgi:hypothetical protein